MITLLASIAGFITSIIPELLKFWKDSKEKQHALDILDRQHQYAQGDSKRSLEELYIARDISDNTALYNTYTTGISIVDALNGSVRPVLAYSFFILYAATKIAQYLSISSHAIVLEYIDILWSVDDQAIFAVIISFYFGQRTFSKIFKNRFKHDV